MGWTALIWLGGGFLAGSMVRNRVSPKPPKPPSSGSANDGASALDSASADGPTSANDSSPSPPPDQWQMAYHLAAEMAQLKAGFLARTSHELRSPLNSVISLHQLILSDLCDSPEEEREFVSQSYDSARKLLTLLDQLTDLSKLEHGREALSLTDVDLNELLEEVEQVVQIQAQNRNLRLTIEHPDAPLAVVGDRQRLLQVLIHLLTTPIYQMDSGHIDLKVQYHDGQVAIQVLDQRPASSWSETSDLLQAPSQDGGPSAAKPEAAVDTSAGLTLMLCQQLMALMGGELVLLQTPTPEASWTKLECRLPLAAREGNASSATSPTAPA